MRRCHVLSQAEPAQRGAAPDNANLTLSGLGHKSGHLGEEQGGSSVLCFIRKKVLLLNLGHPFTCFRSGVLSLFYSSKDPNHRHQFPETAEKSLPQLRATSSPHCFHPKWEQTPWQGQKALPGPLQCLLGHQILPLKIRHSPDEGAKPAVTIWRERGNAEGKIQLSSEVFRSC